MNKENTNTQQVNHHLVFVSLLNWFSKKFNFIVTMKAGLPLLGEMNNIDDEEERKAFRMVEKVRIDKHLKMEIYYGKKNLEEKIPSSNDWLLG